MPRGVYKKCLHCKVEFFNPHFYESRGRRKYCSKPCYYASRMVTKSCNWCKKSFTIRISYQSKGWFCSRRCSANSISGEKISNWAQYHWSKKIRDRDGRCAECGTTENLEAHHIVPIYEDASLALNLDNGIALCQKCHKETPTYGKRIFLWKKEQSASTRTA